VAVLCSQRAPGLVQLLNTDTRRGIDYDIVCCITSSDTFAEEVRVERRGVPCLPHSIRRFCAVRGVDLHDLEARCEYDAVTLDLLAPFSPDLLILLDYRLLLTPPALAAFAGRIISIQHGDPVHPLAGGSRVTAHVVTGRPFEGHPVLRSWGITPSRPHDTVAAYSAVVTRAIGLAADLVDRSRAPLNLAAAGTWDLNEDGALVTAGAPAAAAVAPGAGRR
jgi:folate-dependent phosphoribosylglycinamide formyltransferase PurN